MKAGFPKTRCGRILLALAIAALLALLAYWWTRPEAGPTLVTSPVVRGDLAQTVEATGTIDAYKLVSVGAQASGQITSLKVALGDTVKAGDPIAEIDSATQENSLRNAEAALDNLRAQRAAQLATVKEAELAFARQQTMLAADATSRADYASAEATLASSTAQVQAIDAQIVQQQSQVDTANTNLAYTRITAPMDGTVVAVVAEEGQTVNANQSTPTIVKLARLDVMTVNAEISEADVIKVSPGQTVYFTILGDPAKKYYAKLRTIEPAPSSIESDSTSSSSSSSSSTAIYYNALFDVDNPDGTLRIDMTAQVTVVLAEAKDALLVPATALETGSDGTHVVQVVDEKGRPQPRTVTIGLDNTADVEITSGLEAGERVVVGEASAGSTASGNRAGGGPPPMM